MFKTRVLIFKFDRDFPLRRSQPRQVNIARTFCKPSRLFGLENVRGKKINETTLGASAFPTAPGKASYINHYRIESHVFASKPLRFSNVSVRLTAQKEELSATGKSFQRENADSSLNFHSADRCKNPYTSSANKFRRCHWYVEIEKKTYTQCVVRDILWNTISKRNSILSRIKVLSRKLSLVIIITDFFLKFINI